MARHGARSAGLAALAALALGAAVPSGAHGQGPATGSIDFKLVKKARECGKNSVGIKRRCGWRGAYDARLEWSVACGTPGASISVNVIVRSIRRDGRAAPIAYEEFEDQPAAGSATVRVTPGRRLAASAEVTCQTEGTDSEGYPVSNTESATIAGPQVFTRPFVDGWRLGRSSHCNVSLRGDRLLLTLQARQFADLGYGLRFSGTSLLRAGNLARQLRQIKLYARGLGISRRDTPLPDSYRQFGSFEMTVKPRRGGKLKIWAVIGGVRTNTVRVPVLGARGCR